MSKSNGTRISCKRNVKQHPSKTPVFTETNTAMRDAFYKFAGRFYLPVVDACISTKAGRNKIGRGWTANLSPRTTKQLINEGVFA